MADNPDTGGWSRYPSMAPPAESEAPADPAALARYPTSMPDGRAPDRRVPAAPAQPTPTGIRPTEPDPAPAAPAAEGEAAQKQRDGEAAPVEAEPAPAVLPEAYRDLPAPEGLEVDTAALAAVAPDLQRLGVSRQQAEGLIGVLAKLEAQTDQHLENTARAWRASAERLPPAELSAARTVLQGAPAELMRVIEVSRVGDHPAVIRFFARLRSGGSVPADDPEAAKLARRYPSMKGML
jgi:hypothetical protein